MRRSSRASEPPTPGGVQENLSQAAQENPVKPREDFSGHPEYEKEDFSSLCAAAATAAVPHVEQRQDTAAEQQDRPVTAGQPGPQHPAALKVPAPGMEQQATLPAVTPAAEQSHAMRAGHAKGFHLSPKKQPVSPKKQTHSPRTHSKLQQQAIKCIEFHEQRLLQQLQDMLASTAASTAAGAAAGAAIGAGAAVAAAEQALAGRVAHTHLHARSGLMSPPDSMRSAQSARAAALQEFRRQPGAVCAAELQLSTQLEAAEAKLHVHRTAATSARVTIQTLEGLVQQLQLKHMQQEEQLAQQAQRIERQQEQLQQQGQQILRNERELLQQRLRMEQQDTELQIKEHQLQLSEGALRDLRAQGQQQELEQWRQLSTYTSLDEQDLRQEQERLSQDREELAVLEQQLHGRQEELELLQQQVSRQQEQQQEQLQAIREEAQELQEQQEQLRQEQRQLDHQQQEALLLRTHLEQQQQEALQAQAAELERQTLMLARQSSQRFTLSASTSMQGFPFFPPLQETTPAAMPMPAQAMEEQQHTSAQDAAAVPPLALQTAAVDQEPPAAALVQSRTHDVPPLVLDKAGLSDPLLLQQVAQTLASPSSSTSFAALAQVPVSTAESAFTAHLGQSHISTVSPGGPQQVQQTPSAAESASSEVQGRQQEQVQGQVQETLQEQETVQGQEQAVQQQKLVQQQQQGKPLVPLLPTWDAAAHQDSANWQVIPSPSSFAPADMQQYHASAFNSVLQQLTPGGSVDVTHAAAASAKQLQLQLQQQRDIVRVAEYLQALAADNTVLSCEVLHLQQLLVRQRRYVSSSCEAVARKVAAEAVKLAVQLQQWELRQDLQQAALDAAALSHSSCVSSSGGTESQSESGSSDADGAAGEVHKIDFICDVVRNKLSGLLAAHEARLQDLLGHLDDEFELASAEEGHDADIEQQLTALQQVYELMVSESEASGQLQQELLDSAAAVQPGRGSTSPAVQQLPKRTTHGTDPLQYGSPRGTAAQQHPSKPFVTSPSGHVSLVSSRRTSAAHPSPRRPSGTQQQQQQGTSSPLASSRRTSAAHPSPRRPSGTQQQQQQQQQGGASSATGYLQQHQQQGSGVSKARSQGTTRSTATQPTLPDNTGHPQTDSEGSDPAAAAAAAAAAVLSAPAAALLKRRSRLSEFLVGSRGASSGSGGVVGVVDSVLGAHVDLDVGEGVGEGGSEGVGGVKGVVRRAGASGVVPIDSSSRVSQLVQILGGGGDGLVADAVDSDSSSSLGAANTDSSSSLGVAGDSSSSSSSSAALQMGLAAEEEGAAEGGVAAEVRFAAAEAVRAVFAGVAERQQVPGGLGPGVQQQQQQQQQQEEGDDEGPAQVWHRGRSTTLDVLGEVAGRLQSAAAALSQGEGEVGEQGCWEAAAAQLRGLGQVPELLPQQ